MPLMIWSVTGIFFHIKPGYEQAYGKLQIKKYPLEYFPVTEFNANWKEVKFIKTILGSHLLVDDGNGWQHLNPKNFEPQPFPDSKQVAVLVADAISSNPHRYGKIKSIDGNRIITTTKAEITLNWDALTLTQRGEDTRMISGLYKLHYLQWTGNSLLDKVLGFLGPSILMVISFVGLLLAFGKPNRK